MSHVRVAASLWSVPHEKLDAEAKRLTECGLETWHWDRSDGSIGPAGGFTAAEARRLSRLTGLASEAHLMLAEPLAELDDWLEFCEVVVVHLESPQVESAVRRIVSAGARAAVAFSPGSPVDAQLIGDADALVMSVEPGHGGSSFQPAALEQVTALARSHARVGVDGGVTAIRAREAVAAGASWIVSGTALLAEPRAFLSLP